MRESDHIPSGPEGSPDISAHVSEWIFDVPLSAADNRLDVFLVAAASKMALSLSRTRLQALINDGYVCINEKPVQRSSVLVEEGMCISVKIPAPVDPVPRPEKMPLQVVYEDRHILVIDKPAGLVVHPGAGCATGTLINGLLAHCGPELSGIGGVKRPGLVHRLDKETSGLLVVAKDEPSHHILSQAFMPHSDKILHREYLAFVWGLPSQSVGRIDKNIGRHPSHRTKMAIVKKGYGRPAATRWQVVESFPALDVTLLACRLETGRTHQIRVHMDDMGHPLLGDPLYGRDYKTKINKLPDRVRESVLSLSGQALHAAQLRFTHPITGEALSFVSPLPPVLACLHELLRLCSTL